MYDKSEFFKTYFSSASEKPILIDLLGKRLHPSSHAMNILDLGCHDGALMKKIVSTYADRLPDDVVITGVDPSVQAIGEYANTDFSIPVHVNTFSGTAEHYFEACFERFDWIFASQCLYWSPDLSQVIKQIDKAGDSSLIVIRGRTGIYEIQSQFKDYIGNNSEKFYTEKDVEAVLLSQKIPFQKESITTFIQLPPKDSIEFEWLILFFLQRDEQELNNEIFMEVQDWIISKSSERIPHEVHFFWLGNAILAKDHVTNTLVKTDSLI